ncbi:MAG: hypothetical protein RIG27_19315 [Coleofasciculus sp. F4-SAH-05]
MVIGYWSLVIGYWSLVIGHWSLVIGYWSFVIGHWSLVICQVGAGLVTSGCNRKDSCETRPYNFQNSSPSPPSPPSSPSLRLNADIFIPEFGMLLNKVAHHLPALL